MTVHLQKAVQEIKNNARDSSAKSKDVQDASVDFSAAVLNEADKDQNLAAFEAAWQKNARRVRLLCYPHDQPLTTF